MAYADIHNAAIDANFQGRCYVAAWLVAWDLIGNPAATEAQKDWAQKVVTERLSITPKQLAMALMRNQTVQTAIGSATDAELLAAVLTGLDDLVKAG